MIVPGSANPLLLASFAGYQVPYSLRFRASNSAYVSRTSGASPTDQKKVTYSAWMKAAPSLSSSNQIALVGFGSGNSGLVAWNISAYGGRLFIRSDGSNDIQYTGVFRDPTAWGHLVVAIDTTQATASDRVKVYWNGTAMTYLSGTYPTQNSNSTLNAASTGCRLMSDQANGTFIDGYLAETHMIDGQALTPSSFGQTDSGTGVWVPKAYAGTYGTNGFYLKFADASAATAAAIGKDSSGNGNNWTPSGISVTSGVTFDQMTDTPTLNYCVLNPLIPSAANISWANLRSGTTAVRGTINVLLANTYWEVTAGGSAVTAGTISDAAATNTTTVTANKVFGFRLTSAGTLDYINITDAGAWTNIASGLSGQQFPYGTTAAADWNFGQRAFVGTVPSGYAAVSTAASISAAVTTSGSFTGNAAADGPFIWANGNPATLTINGNAVTFGTHADKTAGGFKLRTSSASYNTSGTNNWTATAGKRFVQSKKPNNAQVNP